MAKIVKKKVKAEDKALILNTSAFTANGTFSILGFWSWFWDINFVYIVESFCEFAAGQSEVFLKVSARKEYQRMLIGQVNMIKERSLERSCSIEQGINEVKVELGHLFKRLMKDIRRLELNLPKYGD